MDNTPLENLLPKRKHLCAQLLELIRKHYGKPYRPNNNHRSLGINKEIGSSPKDEWRDGHRQQNCRVT